MTQIVPFLWFEKEAEEAARFYVSLLPDSRIESVSTLPVDTPSGPAGTVQVVDFVLAGRPYQAINAGPLDPFNHAVSFVMQCAAQAEIDRLWDAHLKNGGQAEQCGWLKDRWGLYWQIIPENLSWMMRSTDKDASKRAAEALLKMVKIDIAALERAYDGR
jgi:predicted 3-demethylubiquinone-9 3-methyltransferase (glyoxalase superfamily)